MRSLVAILLLGSATAISAISFERTNRDALSGMLSKRDVCVPVPAPATCEKSCGAGNIQCVAFPNCYNPSAGESCCSDGKYCPAGTYCTDAGCCPNGSSLADCKAKASLSVVPPDSPAPTPVPTASSSSAPHYPTTSTYLPPSNVTYSNATTSLITPPQVTTNAAPAREAGLGFVGAAVGLLLML